MAGSIVDVRQGVRDDGNWRKDKKGVTTSKKKKTNRSLLRKEAKSSSYVNTVIS